MGLVMLQKETEIVKEKYNEKRKYCKKLLQGKKRKYNQEMISNLEEQYKNKEVRSLYRGVKNQKQGYQPRPVYFRNKEGEMLIDEQKILERWREHFEELLHGNSELVENCTEDIDHQHDMMSEYPSIEEIKEICKNLKPKKSPGSDEITAEMLKFGGEKLMEKIQELIKRIWTQEQMPKDWSEAILCPIFKKGDKTVCENYRGIALLNVAYKVMATCIKNRLVKEMENILGEYQCGFRAGRGVVDQIYTLREIQADSYEHQAPTYVLFIEFKQAYDRVNRVELCKTFAEMGISHKIIALVKMMLQHTENRVKVAGRTSDKFPVKEGLRQGDPLSSVLFNVTLEKVIRQS